VHSWLTPPQPSTNHDKALRQRQEGTGVWFLNSEIFQNWKECKLPILWLHGIPGCGKTILSSTIIEHLQQQPVTEKTYAVVYFYFDFTDAQKQSLESALRSLVYQLSCESQHGAEILHMLYKQHGDGKQQPSTEALRKCLQSLLSIIGHVRIVLDALDESTTRREVLDWIQSLDRTRPDHLQVIATSRGEGGIESALGRIQPSAIFAIQCEAVNKDIQAYIKTRVDTDNSLEQWRGAPFQQNIEKALTKKAGNM